MRALAVMFSVAMLVVALPGQAEAQGSVSSVDALVSQAKAAAGTDWAGTFMRLCIPPPAPGTAGGPGGGPPGGGPPAGAPRVRNIPPRESWYAAPARVADNLYFLGTKGHHAWALVGSEGIVIFEALFDYATEDEILGGMRQMGLDPAGVRYIVMSHGHGDHDGGAKLLQDSMPNARLIYGAEDWELVLNSANRPGGTPRRDLDGVDGMVLDVGDASVRIITMPGHTAGTLSYLFEARDNGRPLRVVYVGGTAIPFNQNAQYYDTYLASSRKVATAAAEFGATAVLSNHTEFDNGYYKAHTAAARRGVEPNPFEVGTQGVARYFEVVQRCTEAAKLRATGML